LRKDRRTVWRETAKHERNMKIFREELDGFLPGKILDFHVHVWPEGVLPKGEVFSCAGHPITKYDFDDLVRDLGETYPGRETAAVCFGLPDISYDREANNRYVAGGCNRKRFFAFRLFDPNEADRKAVRKSIIDGAFMGLKPYHNYVRKADPGEVEITQMLPSWIMEIAKELRLVIMLHIPRRGRLADPVNQEQIVRLCREYPDVAIVLAHIGRAYFLRNIAGNLERLKDLPNLYFDLAMLNNTEVLEYLFRTVDAGKILYATDIPIALAPGKSVEINDQYTYVTPLPWHLSISDDHGKLVFTSFLYEELRAIRKAAERTGLSGHALEGIFCENGMRLLQERLSRPPGRGT